MLLPSVLPCENAFRVSRSRTTTRSQSQRNGATLLPAHAQHNALSMSVGLGLSITNSSCQLTPRSERIANSSQALNQILSLDQTPPRRSYCASALNSSQSRYPHSLLATPTPSRTPSPQTPSKQVTPQHTPWTTPGADDSNSSSGGETEVTPRATSGYTYTYTIVTRNNKRKRNESAAAALALAPDVQSEDNIRDSMPRHMVHPFTTPDPISPVCPPAPRIESLTFHPETDDELLDDPFVTPKRTRLRGPASKRLSATRRNLGPWSEEEDKQLVGMVLAKMRLSERDWAECANTLGRDGMSVDERWRGLVEAGTVGLINDKRKEEKMKRARMQGNGRGQLEPARRSGRAGKNRRR
ncbi:hypothetical protein DRE_03008 [Drechslerella stenobrocha 248]|uniref:Myb-like domain-containing protein n=1 Tax=Drechslerella stenobrocha 248 TaxID=1043628 RepID=W7I6H9_9PEZI|nr:hypothetical protein DRE_03008 [Drechslerella stenobrocha 248]